MTRLLFVLLVACGAEETPAPQPSPDPAPVEVEPETEPEEPDEDADFRCETDDECVPSRDECANLVGVRADRAADYAQRIAVLARSVNCAGIGESAIWGEHVGFCVDSRCRAADSGRRCASTDDCVKVEGACGMYDVVHRDFRERVQERFDQRAAVITCPAGRHAPEFRVECREGACVGDVID